MLVFEYACKRFFTQSSSDSSPVPLKTTLRKAIQGGVVNGSYQEVSIPIPRLFARGAAVATAGIQVPVSLFGVHDAMKPRLRLPKT